jgi:antitoxin component of MazEF toxin-antitoxin module
MMAVIKVKITSQGVLVPRPLLPAWDDVQEVEIEQRADAIIIRPKTRCPGRLHAHIVREMKAAGLVEELQWTLPPTVSAEERARLATKLSQGEPLSEIIIADRENRA